MISPYLLECGQPLVRCQELSGSWSSFSHYMDEIEASDLSYEQKTVLLRSFDGEDYNWNRAITADFIMMSFTDPYDITKKEAYQAMSFLVQIGLVEKEAKYVEKTTYSRENPRGQIQCRPVSYSLTSQGLDIWRELQGFKPQTEGWGQWGW